MPVSSAVATAIAAHGPHDWGDRDWGARSWQPDGPEDRGIPLPGDPSAAGFADVDPGVPGAVWWILLLIAVPLLWYLLGLAARFLDAQSREPAPVPAPLPAAPLPAALPAPRDELPAEFERRARAVEAVLDEVAGRTGQGLGAAHEHELRALRAALAEVREGLGAIPADLRERPGGPERRTPLEEALACAERLHEGASRLRTAVFDEAADRLRVLRRYADSSWDRGRLDLG